MRTEHRKKYLKEYMKKYRMENKEILKISRKKYYRKNRLRENEKAKKWKKENPEKVKNLYQKFPLKNHARIIVNNAIKKGTIKRENCFCGEKGQAHHPNYCYPLKVIWLCSQHHKDKHMQDEETTPVTGEETPAEPVAEESPAQ